MQIRKTNFDSLEWQTPMAGVRFKVTQHGSRQLRLVEYTPKMPPHWCEKEHIGYILASRFQIEFDDETIVYETGDGVLLPPGHTDRHRARALTDVVRVIFVEDV